MMPYMAASPAGGMPPPEPRAWVAVMDQIATGDELALSRLYDGTSRLVYGMILRMVREPATAEDITLEVYMQVWRTAGGFSVSRSSVTSWLVMLARSRAIDWLRSSGVRIRQHAQTLDSIPEAPDLAPSPERVKADSDRARVVQRALQDLAPGQREAIELGFFDGLSHSEIAEKLALPIGTVKSRIRTGMIKLRDVLGPIEELL